MDSPKDLELIGALYDEDSGKFTLTINFNGLAITHEFKKNPSAKDVINGLQSIVKTLEKFDKEA